MLGCPASASRLHCSLYLKYIQEFRFNFTCFAVAWLFTVVDVLNANDFLPMPELHWCAIQCFWQPPYAFETNEKTQHYIWQTETIYNLMDPGS